ncbi:uncharacterized protein [Nerophis lumbriciformis]|uniref:uncharacterized protein n=1 Tax=Nerophis lumbriciformis TaxID=546530 RepID=UPI002AE07AEA|nr:uncharacterized protein LOC133610964 [Nerophis lumbriciformis]
MDPARIEGTLWNVLYYITGAVNRFLSSEPPDNDLLQDPTLESSSGGDAHMLLDVKEQPISSEPDWNIDLDADDEINQLGKTTKSTAPKQGEEGGEEGYKTTDEPQKVDDDTRNKHFDTDSSVKKGEEAAVKFCRVAQLSFEQRNTMSFKDNSTCLTSDKGTRLAALEDQLEPEGPKAEDHKEDNQPTDERVEEEDNSIDVQTLTTEKHTSPTTDNLKHGGQMSIKAIHLNEESVMSKSKCFLEELAMAVPVNSEGETGWDKSMSSSVCDDCGRLQELNPPNWDESQALLPEDNNGPGGNTTQRFLEVGDSKETPDLPEKVENREQESLQNSSSIVGTKHETKTANAKSVLPSLMRMRLDASYFLADDDVKDHHNGIKVVELEQGQGLFVATGDNEIRGRTKESIRLGHEKLLEAQVEHAQMTEDMAGSELVEDTGLITEQGYEKEDKVTKSEIADRLDKDAHVVQVATYFTEDTVSQHQDVLDLWIQNSFSRDPNQDQISEEKPEDVRCIWDKQVGYDTESFTEISSSWNAELGFSDQSNDECACIDDATNPPFAAEPAKARELLDMNATESRQLHSGLHRSGSEASLEELARYSQPLKAKFTEFEDHIQVSGFDLNFAPQKSRIALKNPHVRPPKDPRSLLQRPSVDPVFAPPPATKIPAGVQVLGGLAFGIKLPGFPALKKLPKKEAELKPENGETPKQEELPQKPKWMPRQSGFGNPFMSELKTKLKKSTKK